MGEDDVAPLAPCLLDPQPLVECFFVRGTGPPKLKLQNARKGFFERDQYLSVRHHLAAPLQPLVDVAYLTGWRIKNELLNLTWAQWTSRPDGCGWSQTPPS